jgi:hypothetical protein
VGSQGQTSNPPPSPSSSDSASQHEAEYNIVYQQLVANENDIVGQLAYCLYKQSKQKYLREFLRLNHRRPTDSELRIHVNCAELPALNDYREKATQVVSEVLAQAAQEKQEELEEHFKKQLWRFINRHQPESFVERGWRWLKGLMYGGAGGVVGNFLTTVVVLLILFGAASSSTRDEFTNSAKESFVSGLAQVIGVGVTISRTDEPKSPGTPASAPTQPQ